MWRKTVWLIATLTLSIFVAPVAWAQNPGKVYRVGVVEVLAPNRLPPNSWPKWGEGTRVFMDRLANHGYIEGKNLVIEARFGAYERLAELAAELVRLKVDVIYTGGTKASRIVSAAVKETPLVMFSCDPFEHVARLARPEGNLTGVTCMTTELSPKRLELLKEAVPNAVRVVFLSDPADAPLGLKLTQDAASRLGIKLHVTDVQAADGLQSWGESDLQDRLECGRKGGPRRVVRLSRRDQPSVSQADRGVRGDESLAHDVRVPSVRRRWRPHVIRGQLPRDARLDRRAGREDSGRQETE